MVLIVPWAIAVISPSDAFAQSIQFNPPPSGAPGNREAGSARGSCLNLADQTDARGLTALLPDSNLGLTTQAFPRFFAYIPAMAEGQIEFVLYKGENPEDAVDPVYSATIAAPGEAGIVMVSLPDDGTIPELQVGETYIWYFSVVCENARGGDMVVQGYTQRVAVDANLNAQLQGSSPSDRPALYAEAGIWQDALTELSTLWQSTGVTAPPPEQWQTLLQLVGLSDIATMPLLSDASPAVQ